MRPSILLGALLASACGAPLCETACGLTANEGSCEALQLQETRALESFEASVERWTYSWTCDRLTGYRVEVDPGSDGSGFHYSDEVVLGYTSCATARIVTANTDWRHNAFTHELAHVIEGCDGPPVYPAYHYGWEVRRINAAVNNATRDP